MSKNHKKIVEKIIESIDQTVIADKKFIETVLTGFTAKGHVLIEDMPGTGKTLTSKSLAESTGLKFKRIQFTPDLLPSDITGTHIYNEDTGKFEFNKGPLFTNILLADEINRAPPKTQAALLEAMAEKQVTVDNQTFELPNPFFVIATQNPIEQQGTFPLPEAQKDRFMIKTSIGYPNREGERKILEKRASRSKKIPQAPQKITKKDSICLQNAVEKIECKTKLMDYIIDICRSTRKDSRIKIGVSPRGIQRLFEATRAHALIQGRNYVIPQDIKNMAKPTLAHRIILSNDAKVGKVKKQKIIQEILNSTQVPDI